MDVTIRKPGVIAPSQIPKNTRQAKSPPKLVAAAWHSNATAHIKMLILNTVVELMERNIKMESVPHPLGYREALQRKILRPFKGKEEEVEYRA